MIGSALSGVAFMEAMQEFMVLSHITMKYIHGFPILVHQQRLNIT